MGTDAADCGFGVDAHVLVVDGSRVARRLIRRVLETELEGVRVDVCANGTAATTLFSDARVNLVTVALQLPDMDGLDLVRQLRDCDGESDTPVVVVSGDVDEHLRERTLGVGETDYFDKSLGYHALVDFIRGYVNPRDKARGEVLYIEDSRVVTMATRRMLEKHGLTVHHANSAEDALAMLEDARVAGRVGADVVLTDVTVKGSLTGGDLLRRLRGEYGYSRSFLPVVVMTGDGNRAHQAALIRDGANDLVEKPVREQLLITKLLFQLRVARHVRGEVDGRS